MGYLEGQILKFEAFSGLGLEFLPMQVKILKFEVLSSLGLEFFPLWGRILEFSFWEVCGWIFSARVGFRQWEGGPGSVGKCR